MEVNIVLPAVLGLVGVREASVERRCLDVARNEWLGAGVEVLLGHILGYKVG